MRTIDAAIAIVAVFGLTIVAAIDLENVARNTLTVYTTPALRDLVEKELIPRYRDAGGIRVVPVYTAAGEQYNRLRMSGDDPEADLFLHASPLYVQRGFEDGYFLPLDASGVALNDTFLGPSVNGGVAWMAFAWTPVVEVYAPHFASVPDVSNADLRFGLPHPRLSNNGIYNVLLFESVSPEAGQWVLERTVVQPINARTSIGGVVDGSFDVTLGYDAVTKFYQKQGAKVKSGPPNFDGENVTTPVLVTAGLVKGTHEKEAQEFIESLFRPETQANLTRFFFRPVLGPDSDFASAFPAEDRVRMVHYDWTDWKRIDSAIPRYEVTSSDYA